MNIIDGIPTWGEIQPEALEQLKKVNSNAIQTSFSALMADHHLGYSVPVGGVVAYENHININGVGFDIACGNKAVLLDCPLQEIKKDIYRTMNEVQKHISFGIGSAHIEMVYHLKKENEELRKYLNKFIDKL
jgi:tRNA-splicing ligase RtcB